MSKIKIDSKLKPMFICDRKKCGKECPNPLCLYTSDISHALCPDLGGECKWKAGTDGKTVWQMDLPKAAGHEKHITWLAAKKRQADILKNMKED